MVDQDENPKASVIRAGYSEPTAQLGKGEGKKKTGNRCGKLPYHIFTASTSATLTLHPEGHCERSHFSSITVHMTIVPCSIGFEKRDDRCVCERRLSDYFNITICDIDTNSIKKTGFIWLRYDEMYLKGHTNCPLDYCQSTADYISLEFPDMQCANNHSGIICGACRDNFSIGLGGSRCLECTSNYTLIWLIPVFAAAGIALVALLLVCNITISHGTLNGLVFYANVVSITGLSSLQNCSIHPILSVFIAWVNLDFGVETCFYSGMDTYQKTWLQFAFPLYIWVLVGAIIVASYYSSLAMKAFGKNNVAILATLFLLSYTKILKTIITALNFTQVMRSSVHNVSAELIPYKVWTYDGNVEYLKGKHVGLFVAALVMLIFFFLPYTLLLTVGQCLRSMPARRRWVLRCIRSTAFVSIMDAYHAPYNKKHRYWTGLMLLTRCVLFLAFVSAYRDNELLANMFITTLILIAILALKTCATKVYKNFYTNLLELSFLLNLAVLSVTLHHLRSNGSDNGIICKCTSGSIAVSMATFIGILTYHAHLKLGKTRCCKSIKATFLAKLPKVKRPGTVAEKNPPKKLPTTTNVELREELLASDTQ